VNTERIRELYAAWLEARREAKTWASKRQEIKHELDRLRAESGKSKTMFWCIARGARRC
jgi:DNA repair ATPase RecN